MHEPEIIRENDLITDNATLILLLREQEKDEELYHKLTLYEKIDKAFSLMIKLRHSLQFALNITRVIHKVDLRIRLPTAKRKLRNS